MTLPNTFAHHIIEIDNQDDVTTMLKNQDDCLEIYQSSQRNLEAFNNFSESRYRQVHGHFEAHTKLLHEVKSDLNGVFIKLKKVKALLEQQYPVEMNLALDAHPPLVVTDD
ncbi:hypothetical protein BCR42DRAFT_413755 [Absidia repens]|uniref:KxDL domain-containing protein n=1 Tax=Absidia repens TaxID=90262 RepID=A0A1X2IIA0_9FUNG|nr:hypothetical protein BCR42DRAFT_413755 [Absidia repens]